MGTRHRRSLRAGVLLLVLLTPLHAQNLQDERSTFEFAQKLYNSTSYANAAQEFRLFVINFPTSDRVPEALLRMGEALLLSDQFQEAVEACQSFVDKHPNHFEVPTAMRRKAAALAQLREYTKAGQSFQEVHAAFPGGEYAPQDLLSAGSNFRRGGDLPAAENVLRILIARYPKSPLLHEATYNLGLVLLDDGRVDEAVSQFRTITGYAGDTERKPDALLQMAKVALDQGTLDDAEALISQLRRGFPGSTSAEESYLVMAAWRAARGDWQGAAETYSESRKVLPRNERRQLAVLGLADARRKLGSGDQALSLYTQFLKTYAGSPLVPQARLGLGRAFVDLGDFRSALQAFSRLQEEFPEAGESVEAYADVGSVWRRLGTPRRALEAYLTFLARTGDREARARARLQVAELYEQDLGWHDRARSAYAALADSASESFAAEARFGLARTFEKIREPGLALREYRAYLESFPGGDRATEAESRIRFLREFAPPPGSDRPEKLVDLIAGLPSISSDAEAQYRLGKWLFDTRRYRRASDRFRKVLQDSGVSARAPEAGYLLGECYLREARRAHLEGDATSVQSFREMAGTAHRGVIGSFPMSGWADDAAFSLIEQELAAVVPDTARARQALEAYQSFEKTYAESDRLGHARLGAADAHRELGAVDPAAIDLAIRAYRQIQGPHTASDLRERAAYGLGICQALKKDYVQAEESLRSFLFDFPQSELADHVRFQLGRILLDRGFYRSAAEEFAGLLGALSTLELERASRAFLAECYFRLGDFRSAIEIDEALLGRGATPPLLRRLAKSHRESGQHERAIQVYAAFLRSFPDASDADSIAFSRAELLAYLERIPESIAAFELFGTRYTGSALRNEASAAAGDLLFGTERYREALAAYRRIPTDTQTEPVLGRQVVCLYRLRRVKEARQVTKAFRKAHKQSRAWQASFDVEEGVYYLRSGNFKKARETFERVIKKHPNTQAVGDARYHLVTALYREGKAEEHEEALTLFVRTHTENPHWTDAARRLADLFDTHEHYTQAARIYRDILAKGAPGAQTPDLLAKLMNVHRNLRLYDSAIGYARQIVERFPRDSLATEVRIDIGTMLHDKGDQAQAVQELVPLLKMLKGDRWSLVQYTIGECHRKAGDYESAKREYLKLIYNPQGSVQWIGSAHFGRAQCFEAQGGYGQAIEELEAIRKKFGSASDFGLQAADRIQNIRRLQDAGVGRSLGP